MTAYESMKYPGSSPLSVDGSILLKPLSCTCFSCSHAIKASGCYEMLKSLHIASILEIVQSNKP